MLLWTSKCSFARLYKARKKSFESPSFIKLCPLWDINQDKKPIYINSQNNFTITINRKDSSRIESASVAERESIFHN